MFIGEDENFKRENDWSDEGGSNGRENSGDEVDNERPREEVEDE